MSLDLATSRYQAVTAIEESGRLPLGITKGRPRWRLAYNLAGNVRTLGAVGPGEFTEKDRDRFAALYRSRMDDLGIDQVRTLLQAAAGDHDRLVLLCYEDVHKPGEWCHRRIFAEWWEEHTGKAVPELPHRLPGRPRKGPPMASLF